jgi:hypothetical protein
MRMSDLNATPALVALFEQIHELGLEEKVAELDELGYTVVEPAKVDSGDLAARLLAAVVTAVERRVGTTLDLDQGTDKWNDVADEEVAAGTLQRPMGAQYGLLLEDPVFEEALLNPAGLALAGYLMLSGGEPLRPAERRLVETFVARNDTAALIKGPTDQPLYLHTDNGAIPSPFPPYAQLCNTTWLLTDYESDSGPLCFVPGSHRWCRHPSPAERYDFSLATPVIAPKGSMVVWGGNMWHGAFPRTAPGLRVTMLNVFCRSYIRGEPIENLTPEVLDRNPPRFAELLGMRMYQPMQVREDDRVAAGRS